jgi:hypothetical protein
MLNRSILTELAALEASFEAGCVASIDLIDSYDNVVRHFLGFIPGGRSLVVRYRFDRITESVINLDYAVF